CCFFCGAQSQEDGDSIRVPKSHKDVAGSDGLFQTLVVFEKMEKQMRSKFCGALLGGTAILTSFGVSAGFSIDQDAQTVNSGFSSADQAQTGSAPTPVSPKGFILDNGADPAIMKREADEKAAQAKKEAEKVAAEKAAKAGGSDQSLLDAGVAVSDGGQVAVKKEKIVVHVTYKGERDEAISPVGGAVSVGKGQTIQAMLKQVVPPLFTVFLEGNVDLGLPATGGVSPEWLSALNRGLWNTQYIAIIDWNKNTVTLTTLDDAAKSAPVTRASFALYRGQSVMGQLIEWSKNAGWVLRWDMARDWDVASDAVFYGGFQQAVTDAIGEIAANGVDIRADVYSGNRTIVVHSSGVSSAN
ncbi:TcpQ domain-containing protein, partial [Ferrovum sp.]|uniref:TcpQ domain-containing protein n=1 Tax=Ferrovum sp. TaxID=2609467 RepID=UPI00260A4387